jgi:hypothetical protein
LSERSITRSPGQPRHPIVVERVRVLADSYTPPDFAEVPCADAAVFLCAIDHRTGYERPHLVAGEGRYTGSALLWALGLDAERRRPGFLTASRLATIDADEVAATFGIEGETVAGPDVRARLWRDVAGGLEREYGGDAGALLDAAGARLGGEGGLLARLAECEAYSDPLQKKSFLFAKIAARRGWFEPSDPESWEVCADNVLMRLALRSGLVEQGPLDEVCMATREAWKRVAVDSGVPPPVLDDLLWELGRDDPDLLGTEGGDVREPPRDPRSHWY